MPTPTYTPLATTTLGSSASSLTFSSIPATYRDLVLVISSTTVVDMLARLNGDTGSNYFRVFMIDNAGSGSSGSQTNTSVAFGFGENQIFQFMDYSATNKHKTILCRMNTASSRVEADAQRWANTAAITSILIYGSAGNLPAGTSFSLYGIAS
jgi:hypothetical protein